MSAYPYPSELQYMKGGFIDSNSQFFYKDLTSFNYDHRIKLDPDKETKMDIRNQIPVHHLSQSIIKELPETNDLNAFEKADTQSEFTKQCSLHRYQLLLQKEKDIAAIVKTNFKAIKDSIQKEKDELKQSLTKIIRDTLVFSKNNNPMNSMLPNHISEIITKIKTDKNINISISSLNISSISKGSKASTKSIKKYESHSFLKSLGLDFKHLTHDNINIDIEKAYEYVKSWNTTRKDVNDVIKYLVVNEIMSVEEKKASKKVERLNKKIKKYKEKKKENHMKYKKELEEAMKADDLVKPRMTIKQLKLEKRSKSGLKPSTAPMKKETKISERLLRNPKSKLRRKKDEPKEKVRYQYNAYQHVDKILNFISNSDELSDNPAVCKHFLNIKNKKRMDDLTQKLIMKNRLEVTIENPETKSKN